MWAHFNIQHYLCIEDVHICVMRIFILPGHSQSPDCACGLLYSQVYVRAFAKLSMDISFPSIFLLKFLVSPLFPPTSISTSGRCDVKQLWQTVLDKPLRIWLTPPSKFWARSGKVRPWYWSSPVRYQTGQAMTIV